jgi:prepilin signal peptidase PulO-like enzyme (type II secretory pathway)
LPNTRKTGAKCKLLLKVKLWYRPGLSLNLLLPGAAGFWQALAGFGIGLAALLPMYLMRMLGAGDVKLMAMVGAFPCWRRRSCALRGDSSVGRNPCTSVCIFSPDFVVLSD